MLSVSHLTASYGVAQALFGVNFELADGEVTALMGRNGMGKTTTVKAICRIIPSQGGLAFDGQDLQVLHSHQAARLGLGLPPKLFWSGEHPPQLRVVGHGVGGGGEPDARHHQLRGTGRIH